MLWDLYYVPYFCKTVLKKRLESLGIDPAKYEVKNFTEAKRKRMQKRRGIHCEREDAEEVEIDGTNQSDSRSINPISHGGEGIHNSIANFSKCSK